ncbi:MAG: GatB/YqeY domain-containing protein [Acidobacteriota bacterium]
MSENKSLRQRIDEDLRGAMKAGDKTRLGVLRLIKTKMLEAEVALRAGKGRDYQLEDAEANRVLAICAKQRRDAIESFEKGGRDDLVAAERAELAILREYLPEQLTTEQITRIVQEAIASTGAASPRDIGAVMKVAMPRMKGAADGRTVNRIASSLLAGK